MFNDIIFVEKNYYFFKICYKFSFILDSEKNKLVHGLLNETDLTKVNQMSNDIIRISNKDKENDYKANKIVSISDKEFLIAFTHEKDNTDWRDFFLRVVKIYQEIISPESLDNIEYFDFQYHIEIPLDKIDSNLFDFCFLKENPLRRIFEDLEYEFEDFTFLSRNRENKDKISIKIITHDKEKDDFLEISLGSPYFKCKFDKSIYQTISNLHDETINKIKDINCLLKNKIIIKT